MTNPDPLAQVRAEFAAGLDQRVDTMRAALGRLEQAFLAADAETLYRAAHSLTGTAASFGAQGLAHVAGDLENLARRWLERGEAPPEERRVAAAAVTELGAAAREYRATVPAGSVRSPAARLAVVGELSLLINAAVDMRQIFEGAILKVQRVLDFRRASVVLIDESATHYALHTLFDRERGGFIPGEAVFPVEQGVTGEAMRTGRPIRVQSLPGTEGILLQEGRRVSALIVPLHLGDRVIGALNFGHEEPGHYLEEDLDWAVVLGRQIETSLYYSKLLGTIAQQREALAREHAAVQRERNQLEALIDASDAAIMLVGPDRKIAYANAETARLVGIPREAILGASVDSVHRFLAGSFVDPSALAVQEKALTLEASLHDQVELTFPERAVYQRVVAPVRESGDGGGGGGGGGALLGHIVLYRNVTREVEADRTKSEFVSVVSHELRTPMTSVKTSLSLLLAGAGGHLEDSSRELLEIALRNADRLIRLVNDLLDLSRLQAGRMEFRLEPVALREAIEASVDAVAAFAGTQGATIAVSPPSEAVSVQGVRDRVEQVMVNLLANAIKFSPRGGQIAVRWWRENDGVVTQVADEGRGIPADKLQTIFEPFRQLDSSTTREHGGAGLGLTISRDIVEAFGGKVWAESEVGSGSRFFVRLPLATGQEESAEPSPPPGAAPRPVTVLVAHSDPDWQRLAVTWAQPEQWRIVAATTAAEALAHLQDGHVHLAVIAQELADMHGLELLQRLRADPRLFDLPVVIVGEADASTSLEYGADAWTAADPRQLVDAARRLLQAPLRKVVLLVEDDPAARAALSKALRRTGYACLTAGDARQALEFARRRKPAVVLTDFHMPGMDGVAFLHALHNDPTLKAVPAVILTGHATPALAREAAELSAPLFTKPADMKRLLQTIKQLTDAV